MDSSITLSYGTRNTSTMVSNNFIDKYMTDARGSDVKVYIYLLRCQQSPSAPVSIESIAEALDETEKDIRTALKYWDKMHVLSVRCSRDGKIKNITLHDLDETDEDSSSLSDDGDSNITILSDVNRNVRRNDPVEIENSKSSYARRSLAAVPSQQPIKSLPDSDPIVKPNYSSQMIQGFKNDYPDFDELINYIENALGKTLTYRDLQTPSFIFEGLGFSTDLICFLYDHCIEKNKRSNSYIEKIARDWHSKGITTITEAMIEIDEFNNRYSAVKNSFGINRNFGEAELVYIKKWYYEFHFTDDVISYACDKAILNTSQPKFQYADKILTDWNDRGIRTLEDAKADSAGYQASAQRSLKRNVKNSSLQYSQRDYSEAEISAIEKKKLGIL